MTSMNTERQLVTVRTISELAPIDGADNIEVATVDGWKCVVKKGDFKVGDRGVYFEIDSLLPIHPLFSFLANKGTRRMIVDGVERVGHRLKTIKLRGQVSQGLLLPYDSVKEYVKEGEDLASALGVYKWEAPIAPQLVGKVKGNFPEFIKKTDQERCQNLVDELGTARGMKFEVTEKLDGSSMTVYLKDGVFGVCSRNLDLKEGETPEENCTQWKVARALDLETKLRAIGRNLALQGELVGEGIQKNPYKLNGQHFYLFDIWDIDNARHLSPSERWDIAKIYSLPHVPLVGPMTNGIYTLEDTIDGLLKRAEGKSYFNDAEREGIVFKSLEPYGYDIFSFKAISNAFLLKE